MAIGTRTGRHVAAVVLATGLGLSACSGGDDAPANDDTSDDDDTANAAGDATEPSTDPDDGAARPIDPATESATTTTSVVPPTTLPRERPDLARIDPETGEPVDEPTFGLGPTTYDEVVDFGVEAGLWDERDGLTRVLGYALGLVDAAQAPGVDEVLSTELHDVLARAHALSLDEAYADDDLADLRAMYELAVPSPGTIDAIAGAAVRSGARGIRARPRQTGSDCTAVDSADFADWAVVEGCYRVLEDMVAGATLRVLYPVWYDDDADLAMLPLLAREALLDSITVYEPLGEIGDVDVLFSITDTADQDDRGGSDGTLAVANYNGMWGLASVGDTCPVTVFPAGFAAPGPLFQQTVAHEVWHCVQKYSGYPQGVISGTKWYREGGAEFFSNVVYPSANDEHQWISVLDERSVTKPLWAATYDGWMWWQYLSNRTSPNAVADLHLQMMLDGDGGKGAMAGYGATFQKFIVEFVAGTIADQSGERLDPARYYRAANHEVTKNDTSKTYEVTADPFVGARQLVKYDKELRVFESDQTTTVGEVAMVLAGNRRDLSAWKQIFPEVRSKCKQKATYIVVATTQEGSHAAKIQIDRIEEAPCDPCVLGGWETDLDTFETMLLNRIVQEGGALPAGTRFEFSGHYYSTLADDGVFYEQRDGMTGTITVQDHQLSWTIDAFAQAEFTADGERISIKNAVELYNEVTASADGINLGNIDMGSGVIGGAGGTYECRDDDMIVHLDGFTDPLRFIRIDKILTPPDTIPA